MSGRSCATTGSRTGSLHLTTTSSAIAATPGTSSSISPGASCPSACATGPTGSDQWDLVLDQHLPFRADRVPQLRPRLPEVSVEEHLVVRLARGDHREAVLRLVHHAIEDH